MTKTVLVAAIGLVATAALGCDEGFARLCQEALWAKVNTMCPLSPNPEQCRFNALQEYASCKSGAGCAPD